MGIPDRMYMQPFTTSGYECSMLRKGGYYAGDYLYYMPVIFSTDETLLCRAEAYTLKRTIQWLLQILLHGRKHILLISKL